MSQVTITINADNAAFEDDNKWPEVGRILQQLADNLKDGETPQTPDLRDINGNKVGTFAYTEDWDGTEGQDRESYSDDQDRESYLVSDGEA